MSRLTGLPRMSQMAARVIGWKYPTTVTTSPSKRRQILGRRRHHAGSQNNVRIGGAGAVGKPAGDGDELVGPCPQFFADIGDQLIEMSNRPRSGMKEFPERLGAARRTARPRSAS